MRFQLFQSKDRHSSAWKAFAKLPVLLGGIVSIIVSILVCLTSSGIEADVIRLRSGGEIRGQFEEEVPEQDAPLVIRSLSGATIEVDRQQIDYVERRSPLLEEYETRSRRMEPTVEAHWQLAEWCRSHQLSEQREEQLQELVRLDPDHADARRLLGHQKHRGQWMSYDDMMSQRGYVKHRGKWMTPQELALITTDLRQREAEIEWYSKVRTWVSWVTGTDRLRVQRGLEQFAGVDQPYAIPALRRLMETHDNSNVRLLFVKVLGQIPGSDAVPALVDRYLNDELESVRRAAMDLLVEQRATAAVPMLCSALSHPANLIVRRAAQGLGRLGDASAVPALIDALITTHRVTYTVAVPDAPSSGFGISDEGQVSVGFGNPYGAWSRELYAAAITGQVAIANSSGQTRTLSTNVSVKNGDVLNALETLTGKNLGFNERDWYLWWSVQKS